MQALILMLLAAAAVVVDARPPSEVLGREAAAAAGVAWRGNSSETSSHDLLSSLEMPASYTWCNLNGTNYCTMSRNQHIPQYCGSCWAHGAVSALADRVKIARRAQGPDINPSVQHMLNCNGLGSCHGGFVDGPYQWIHKISKKTGTGISYESAQPYMACSSDSKEGFCSHADWSCTPSNVARTCSTFSSNGGFCTGLSRYPNITISEYGSISGAEAMMKEIFHRGPISCGVDADPLRTYTNGIVGTKGKMVDHVISVVGWGTDAEQGKYWHVRNSWGEYWGELGFFRVKFGALLIEDQCSWAVLDKFTTETTGFSGCYEDGTNCKVGPSPGPGPSPAPRPSPTPGPSPGPEGCKDKEGFCSYPDAFNPKKDCDLLAKDCLKTCGCCSTSPPSYCPSANKAEVVV